MEFDTILIIALVNALVSNIICRVIRYLIENKGKFKFTLKKKRSPDDDPTVYHPNTPFTFDEHHNFVGH
jgi:hypothetical protein